MFKEHSCKTRRILDPKNAYYISIRVTYRNNVPKIRNTTIIEQFLLLRNCEIRNNAILPSPTSEVYLLAELTIRLYSFYFSSKCIKASLCFLFLFRETLLRQRVGK